MLARLNNIDWNTLLWWMLSTALGTTFGMIVLVIGIQELGVPLGTEETGNVDENATSDEEVNQEASTAIDEAESDSAGTDTGEAVIETDPDAVESNPALIFLGFPLFAVAGAIVGAAQWVVLRRLFSAVGWWFALTAAGWSVGYLLTVILLPPLFEAMPWFLAALAPWLTIGALTGAFQWILLRRHLRSGGTWWVIVSAVALMVGINVWMSGAGGSVIEATCGGLMGWAGGGALSGIVLLMLSDAQLELQ